LSELKTDPCPFCEAADNLRFEIPTTPSVFPVIGGLFAVLSDDGGGTWLVDLGASDGIDPAPVPTLLPVFGATPPLLGADAAGPGLPEPAESFPPLAASGEITA